MNARRLFILAGMAAMSLSAAHADYRKGDVMFQIYGGGGALGGRYRQHGVDKDDQDLADGGGVIGGQFLYYMSDSPCLALGFDISHAGFDTHETNSLLPNRFTKSSADTTTGLIVARLAYPKGHFRPYIQAGLGAQRTNLFLEGTPNGAPGWTDTGSLETRTLLDDGHVGPAVAGSIGLHVYLTERFFLGVEYKDMVLFGKDFSPTAAGEREGLLKPSGTVGEAAFGFMLGLGF